MTAVELVRDTIRMAILRGELAGGTRLVQTEIAQQLGVSTTPVREAMRALASEGMITLGNHRIGTVRSLAWDEMIEIIDIRRALEEVAIRLAINTISDAELEKATALAEELAEEEDLGPWVQMNIDFHSIFHRATSTKRLADVLINLEAAMGVFVAQAQRLNPEIRDRAVAEHYALLKAYEDRDEERALKVQLRHLDLPLQSSQMDSSRRRASDGAGRFKESTDRG
ncbi:MAG TPA: GntR family transcriptional regulator [Acidimicrobiia bacterium]|nr:GntR family transcriptional regulator [Acidimicrobiia bacterium]